jgi:hypothetical protein
MKYGDLSGLARESSFDVDAVREHLRRMTEPPLWCILQSEKVRPK